MQKYSPTNAANDNEKQTFTTSKLLSGVLDTVTHPPHLKAGDGGL